MSGLCTDSNGCCYDKESNDKIRRVISAVVNTDKYVIRRVVI